MYSMHRPNYSLCNNFLSENWKTRVHNYTHFSSHSLRIRFFSFAFLLLLLCVCVATSIYRYYHTCIPRCICLFWVISSPICFYHTAFVLCTMTRQQMDFACEIFSRVAFGCCFYLFPLQSFIFFAADNVWTHRIKCLCNNREHLVLFDGTFFSALPSPSPLFAPLSLPPSLARHVCFRFLFISFAYY